MKNTLSRHSKSIAMYVCMITLFATLPSQAEPQQRMIIHFKQSLTELNKNNIKNQLNLHLTNGYSITEHSNKLRWIISLNSQLDSVQQNIIKGELLKNTLIKEIEVDKLLLKKITIQAQLLPL